MKESNKYDLIIVGGGPGGYVAAERAGARGLKTLLIERHHLGGVCLNEGCIPSKSMLFAAKTYTQALGSAKIGVEVQDALFRLSSCMQHKQKVIETLRQGVASQMKHAKVEVVKGFAQFLSPNSLEVAGTRYQGDSIIVATGSSPVRPPIPGVEQPHVLTSSEIFDITALPKNLVIVGGGVIGCEFASFFSQVGCNVTVVELMEEIVPVVAPDLAQILRGSLHKVDFKLGCRVESIGNQDVTCRLADGTLQTIPADQVLLSVGRSPNTKGFGLETIGLDMGRQGIRVDERMRTNLPNFFAIGDVVGTSMLAHSASRMGEVVVNQLAGQPDRMRYDAIPMVVYTNPEIASVGMDIAEAKERGIEVESAQLPMQFNGRFLAENPGKRGLCRVVIEKSSRRLLGLHLAGGVSSELVYGAAAMIEGEYRVQDIREVVFPHPTVSEIFRDTLFQVPDPVVRSEPERLGALVHS